MGQLQDDIVEVASRAELGRVADSDDLRKANAALRKFLYANVYYHPRVAKVNQRACEMLKKVFEFYVADPGQLGEVATKRIEQEGLHRTVCDYVAGMTDRYLIEEYARITGERGVLP